MKVTPRFRIGPFQASGGTAATVIITVLVVGLCCCLPLAQGLLR